MTREQALQYVSFCVDDTLNPRRIDEMPANARLVGPQWLTVNPRILRGIAMTTNQAVLIRRFAWLCSELRAGNEFSADTLLAWEEKARAELHRDAKAPPDRYGDGE